VVNSRFLGGPNDRMIANAIENLLLLQLRGCGVDDLPRCHDQGMGLVAGDLERPGLRAALCPGGG
jgi:hypothetical protein